MYLLMTQKILREKIHIKVWRVQQKTEHCEVLPLNLSKVTNKLQTFNCDGFSNIFV